MCVSVRVSGVAYSISIAMRSNRKLCFGLRFRCVCQMFESQRFVDIYGVCYKMNNDHRVWCSLFLSCTPASSNSATVQI